VVAGVKAHLSRKVFSAGGPFGDAEWGDRTTTTHCSALHGEPGLKLCSAYALNQKRGVSEMTRSGLLKITRDGPGGRLLG
jgi:hypothetical protein